MQPENRPKRPVYRSYGELIAVLVSGAKARVRESKQPDPIPPVPSNRTIRRLAAQYSKHRKLARRAEVALSNMNLNVQESGSVGWSYSYRNRMAEKPSATRQKRFDQILRLRVKATLDTMDMTPTQAKAYLLKLERSLSEI